MNGSIHIDPKDVSDWQPEKRGGSVVRHAVSPYDIPEDVLFWRTDDEQAVVLQFSYPGGPESTKERQLSPHVLAMEGKLTGRLYRVDVKLAELVGSSCSLEDFRVRLKGSLTEAINALSNSLTKNAPPVMERYDVSARVLTTVRDTYLDSLSK